MPSELTPRQAEVLAAIKRRMDFSGPTIRQLMVDLGIRSPNGVLCHLWALENKGFIAREFRRGHNIRLCDIEGAEVEFDGERFKLVKVSDEPESSHRSRPQGARV